VWPRAVLSPAIGCAAMQGAGKRAPAPVSRPVSGCELALVCGVHFRARKMRIRRIAVDSETNHSSEN
jgi:hypothetical protein